MVKYEVLVEIDKAIKSVWLKDIRRDYFNGALLHEDSLKCSLYYHLRKKLDRLLQANNLRLYGEYTFPSLKYRADLVIAEIDREWKKSQYLKSAVTDIVAVVELKFTDGVGSATDEWVRSDLRKFKRYFQDGSIDCQFYFGIIYEVECSTLTWVDGRSVAPGTWGHGRVTELDAGLIDGRMSFEVHSYNGIDT